MWDDEQIEVTATAEHVLIVVTEEHAMDSYNEEFRNAIKLPFAQVRELVAFLQDAIAAGARSAETAGLSPKDARAASQEASPTPHTDHP